MTASVFDLRGWQTVSPAVREQAQRVARLFSDTLGSDLTGVYAQGSMALNAFLEGASDLDMLIVSKRRMPRDERLRAAEAILEMDNAPCPVELSVVREADWRPWRHPTRCQFHYSAMWKARYASILRGEDAPLFLLDEDFEDPDIACHARLTRERGIRLLGEEAKDAIPDVPDADFWRSISNGAGEGEPNASETLILGRVLSWREEGRVLSKYEAGLWMAERMPEAFRETAYALLRAHYGGKPLTDAQKTDAAALHRALADAIRAYGDGGMNE